MLYVVHSETMMLLIDRYEGKVRRKKKEERKKNKAMGNAKRPNLPSCCFSKFMYRYKNHIQVNVGTILLQLHSPPLPTLKPTSRPNLLPSRNPLRSFLLKEHAREVLGLLDIIRQPRAPTILSPRIMVILILAELRIHKDVRGSDQGRHDVSMQAICNDEPCRAKHLEPIDSLGPRALVLAGLVLGVEFSRVGVGAFRGVDPGGVGVLPIDLAVRDVTDGAAQVEMAGAGFDGLGVAGGDLPIVAA